jgi:hypothetical protein
MHRETAHTLRRSRSLIVLLLALAIVAVFGIAAQQALASPAFVHGGAACSSCHNGSPASGNVTSARCITCHTGYATLPSGKTCWTCHTPGQAMGTVKTGAPADCTTVCHLANGTDSTHVAHVPDRGVCTTCHPLTVSATNANGSWHHTVHGTPAPVVTKVTIKAATSVKVKKQLTISGKATPTSLSGKSVKITIQMKSGAKWKTVKSASAKISTTGAYSYKYKPTKKGSYHAKISLAASTGFKAASSSWKAFKVK